MPARRRWIPTKPGGLGAIFLLGACCSSGLTTPTERLTELMSDKNQA